MHETPEKLIRETSVLGRIKWLLKDSVIYGILMAVSKFSILLLLPVYTTFLSAEQYGVLDTIILIGTLLTIILIMGQDETLGRFYYDKPPEERKSLIASSLIIMVCGSIVIGILCLVFTRNILLLVFNNTTYAYEFRLIILYALMVALLNFSRSLARWNFQKRLFFILSAGPTLLILILTYVAIAVFELGVHGAILAQIAANTVFVFLAIYCFRNAFSVSSAGKSIIPFLKYGVPIMIAVAITGVFNIVDKSLYISLVGEETLGFYSLAFRYALFISIPLTAFWVAWGPMLFSIYKEKNANDTVGVAINIFAAIFALMLLLQSCFAEIVISVIGSQKFAASIKYFIPISLSIILESYGNLTAAGVDLAKKIYLNSISIFIGLVITVILAPPLVQLTGGAGIAYAVLGGRLTAHGLRTFAAYKVYDFRYKLFKPYFILTVGFLLSLAVQNIATEKMWTIIVFRFINVILLVLLIWKVLINKESKKKLLTMVKTIISKG